MKQILVLAAVLLAAPAGARDIILPLNDQEQASLRQLLDHAVKNGGLSVAPAATHFSEKMQQLQQMPAAAPLPQPSAPPQERG